MINPNPCLNSILAAVISASLVPAVAQAEDAKAPAAHDKAKPARHTAAKPAGAKHAPAKPAAEPAEGAGDKAQ
jgi:hypothetical protein